jgi:hypothetical protein
MAEPPILLIPCPDAANSVANERRAHHPSSPDEEHVAPGSIPISDR